MAHAAALFDLDGTLLTYERTVEEVLAAAFERAGVAPLFDAAAYRARYDEFAERSESVADLRRRCFAALADERGHDPETGRAVARAYTAERDQTNVTRCAGVDRALAAVEDRPAGVVTNGAPEMQATKLEAVGLGEQFSTVVYAGYDAPAKPASEPFERALTELGVALDRAVHVGDAAADVAGANRAGLTSVLVGEPGAVDATPDHAVESVGGLAELL